MRRIRQLLRKLTTNDIITILNETIKLYQNEYDESPDDKTSGDSFDSATFSRIYAEALERIMEERKEFKKGRDNSLGSTIRVTRPKPGDPDYPWEGVNGNNDRT